MKKLLLLAGAVLGLAASPASADIRTLGGFNFDTTGAVILDFSTAQPPGNQPQNNPCIICGANQPNQTNQALNFGYTDYGNTGHDGSETYFSSGTMRDLGLAQDTISGVNYSGAQLIAVVAAINAASGLPGSTGFNIGIDMNQAGNKPEDAQVLESFFLLDVTPGSFSVLFAFSPSLLDDQPLPVASNGTGFPDYQLTGLNTNNLIANHQYAFFGHLTNTSDGPDSFFITPGVAAVPGPIAGAGLPGLVAACAMLFGLHKRRRNRQLGV